VHTGIVCLPALKIKHFALGPQNVVVVCVCVFFFGMVRGMNTDCLREKN